MSLRLAPAVIAVLIGLAAPAFADPYPGYQANVLPATPSSAPYPFEQQHHSVQLRDSAASAFAMEPGNGFASGTGGGSAGYNAAEEDAIINR